MELCKSFEFGDEVEPRFIERSVIETDGTLMALMEGVAEDAVEGGESSASAGEKEGLIGSAGGVETVAGGSLDIQRCAGLRDSSEPGTHLPVGDEADMEFESLLRREAGDGVAATEAVGTEKGEVLAGAVIVRLIRFEEYANDGFAEAAGFDKAGGGAYAGARSFSLQVVSRRADAGEKVALLNEGGLEAGLCGSWHRAGGGTEQTALADAGTAGIGDRNAIAEEAVENGFSLEHLVELAFPVDGWHCVNDSVRRRGWIRRLRRPGQSGRGRRQVRRGSRRGVERLRRSGNR